MFMLEVLTGAFIMISGAFVGWIARESVYRKEAQKAQ